MEIIIRPKKGLSFIDFKELWHYRELFYFLALRDIKLRYKQTVLGVGWAVLQPFTMMVIFSIVFGKIANVPSNQIPYPIFSYAGLLFWNMFSNSLGNASQSLVGSASIIQKVYLPKVIIPAASVIVTFVDFLFSALVFAGIMAYYRFSPGLAGFLILPVCLALTIVTSLGLGWFFAAVNVKYRDVRYALPFFMQLLIYVTPVIYPASIFPQKYQWILFLNPMTGVIETFKALFLGTGQVSFALFGLSAFMGFIFLGLGLWYFMNTERSFADII